MIEILEPASKDKTKTRAIIFDFDGTISTLRCGWEVVMRELMIEILGEDKAQEIDEYIDESTGIQTVYQMIWFRDQATKLGKNPDGHDEWWYKAEYNRRLMDYIAHKKASVKSGSASPEDHMIAGSEAFLSALKDAGVTLYVASGTDDADVNDEVGLLGLTKYFALIKGAPSNATACSKEAVIRMLIEEGNLEGTELVVIGDGKVEIMLAREVGAFALGIASDEEKRSGVNPVKHRRLEAAKANAITGDFLNKDELLALLL